MSKHQIVLNGKSQETHAQTLATLLQELQIPSQHLAVALNNEVIPGSELSQTSIKNGDHVEIVRAVCGG